MINLILEEYEAKRNMNRKLKSIYKQLSNLQKAFIIFFTAGLIALVISSLLEAEKFTIIGMGIYIAIIFFLAVFGERNKYKECEKNAKQYEQDLDDIREVLRKFKVYSKYKLKQLIQKFHRDILDIENSQKKFANNSQLFISSYLGPAIGFTIGCIKNVSTPETLLELGILAIILLFCGKAAAFGVGTMLNELSGDPLGRKKAFVRKLQDILDEDFEITTEDFL